jgi:hypothetical protein
MDTTTRFRQWVPAALLSLCLVQPLHATWSIVAIDALTQEVVVGSATCVANLDLRAFTPVVVVGEGGGAAQAFVDSTGERRIIIHDGIINGLTAQEIVDELEMLPNSPNHQHGVAENDGTAATMTGFNNSQWAGGVVGSFGNVHYAIQGNILTGQPVVDMAEVAFVTTQGDLLEKLMIAMEAAAAFGGDGRCSCSPGDPTGCGSPPKKFEKSAHIGYMIVSRFGDTDDLVCNLNGCADGDYLLNLNIPDQMPDDPDPVVQMRVLFDAFRAAHIGRPDAIESTLTFEPVARHAGTETFRLTLELFDWQGTPLGVSVNSVTVEHAPESDQVTVIGAVIDNGDGTYDADLTWDGTLGIDVFLIVIDDGTRLVVIPPRVATLDLGPIFADGFESGDTSAWSSTVP